MRVVESEEWQYLLKQIAVKSAVEKATFGGYKISISGLWGSAVASCWTGFSLTYPTSTLKLQIMLFL